MTTSSTTPRYVLFMRHARHGPESRDGERVGKAHEVNETGQEQTRSVAERLREQLSEAREGIKLTAILHATSGEAIGTAEIVQWELKTGPQHLIRIPLEGLEPVHAFQCKAYKEKDGDPPRSDALGRHLKTCVEKQLPANLGDGNAILLIGHQPVLGWAANAFTGDSPPSSRARSPETHQ